MSIWSRWELKRVFEALPEKPPIHVKIMLSLPAHLWAPGGDPDRAGRLAAVPHTLHPDLQVLPLHTRNPHHNPPAPVHLPLPRRPLLSLWHRTNITGGKTVHF